MHFASLLENDGFMNLGVQDAPVETVGYYGYVKSVVVEYTPPTDIGATSIVTWICILALCSLITFITIKMAIRLAKRFMPSVKSATHSSKARICRMLGMGDKFKIVTKNGEGVCQSRPCHCAPAACVLLPNPVYEPLEKTLQDSELRTRIYRSLVDVKKKFDFPIGYVSLEQNNNNNQPMAKFDVSVGDESSPNGRRMNDNVHWRIGSVTKTFIATLMIKLVQLGFLPPIDTKINKWFPMVPNANRISLLMLSNMTSGIAHYETDAFKSMLENDPYRVWTPSELLGFAMSQPPLFAPGTMWNYCNTNYILIGLIIEMEMSKLEDSGSASLNLILDKYICKPFGLLDTYLLQGYSNHVLDPKIMGFCEANGRMQDATNWSPSWGWAAGSMVSNARDLHKWSRIFGSGDAFKNFNCYPVRGDQVFYNGADPQLIDRTSNLDPFDRTFFYGAGIMVNNGWIYHNGAIPGYETICAYYPKSELSVVLMVNQTTPDKVMIETKSRNNAVNELFALLISHLIPKSMLLGPNALHSPVTPPSIANAQDLTIRQDPTLLLATSDATNGANNTVPQPDPTLLIAPRMRKNSERRMTNNALLLASSADQKYVVEEGVLNMKLK